MEKSEQLILICLYLFMTSHKDLDLEQKVQLIKEKERGLSHRELKDKLQVLS